MDVIVDVPHVSICCNVAEIEIGGSKHETMLRFEGVHVFMQQTPIDLFLHRRKGERGDCIFLGVFQGTAVP